MYSPKIKKEHIPALYHLGKRVKRPMTQLVNEAIVEYLAKIKTQDSCANHTERGLL